MKAWGDLDFFYHFYFGEGESKTLSSIGLLDQVKTRAETVAISRFKEQILEMAPDFPNSGFVLNFQRSYDFKPVVYSFGDATLEGEFAGTVSSIGKGRMKVSGSISIEFIDQFTDPLSILEILYGSSTSPQVPRWLAEAANIGGTGFRLTGNWKEDFSATIPGTRV